MEIKNKIVVAVIGIADILIAIALMVLPRLFPHFIAGYVDYPFLSEAMLISLAYPFLILLVGTGILIKRDWGRVLGLFLALIAFINAFAEFFTRKVKPELADTASGIQFIFSVIIPCLSIAYFIFHSLILLLFTKSKSTFWAMGRKEEEVRKQVLDETEYYCATCNKPVFPSDEVCPSCGTILKGFHCDKCNYEDVLSKLKEGRCPHCGALVEKD
jgi:hypothetical protein